MHQKLYHYNKRRDCGAYLFVKLVVLGVASRTVTVGFARGHSFS